MARDHASGGGKYTGGPSGRGKRKRPRPAVTDASSTDRKVETADVVGRYLLLLLRVIDLFLD
ncbi:hypothetical protein [Kitasatospora sp. NPDC056531]|uniref:hypothetical protein n=1 Tax=Kitasatospora sp. NPDC056531 TaxID=3345856 RepID=UPI0036971608